MLPTTPLISDLEKITEIFKALTFLKYKMERKISSLCHESETVYMKSTNSKDKISSFSL